MKILCRVALLLVSFFIFCQPSLAAEKITSFDSQVKVDEDGQLTVVETISVVAEGRQIKRGIYRDFPTRYTTREGRHVSVSFDIIGIEKNGQPEPYHTKRLDNGIRIYIGDKNVFLNRGAYTYTIIYQTDRQIGFFFDYDELYWNVTGNGWAFPIDEATATIVLPSNATVLNQSVYTGRQGAKQTNAEVTEQLGSQISFKTTIPLAPREGLTVAVSWPKGVVREPDTRDKVRYFLRENVTAAVGLIGLIILLIYYSIVWAGVGKDPDAGAIIPRFEPPKGYTPAASRFVMRMGFDNKAFAAAIVNLAVKKQLTIDDNKGTFTLKKVSANNRESLSKGEAKILAKLFSGSGSITLKNSNHKKISGAVSALRSTIKSDFETMNFKRNSIYLLPGLTITLIVIVAIFLTSHQKEVAGFMTLWLTLWAGGSYALFMSVFNQWQVALSKGSSKWSILGAMATTLFALPFLGGLIGGTFVLSTATSYSAVFALLFALATNVTFYHLLKAPTVTGRKVMDKLEGLKLYLTVAEKDRLNLLNPPEETVETYEKFLPWALALDVEQQWSEKFSDVLEKASREGSYSPSWYSSHRSMSTAAFASSLGSSLSATISSSSHAPGSRSGSGGGGSSGGGGGGGGGGGW